MFVCSHAHSLFFALRLSQRIISVEITIHFILKIDIPINVNKSKLTTTKLLQRYSTPLYVLYCTIYKGEATYAPLKHDSLQFTLKINTKHLIWSMPQSGEEWCRSLQHECLIWIWIYDRMCTAKLSHSIKICLVSFVLLPLNCDQNL